LLEVGELGDFHPIEPDLPAQAPGAQCWVFPVVFHKPDVVGLGVDAQSLKRAQVELQDVFGGGLEDHLVLVVVLKTIRVLAVATVFGPA